MNKLHTILTNIMPAINESLHCINRGGCGHYAYELNQALAAHGVASSIVLVEGIWDGTIAQVDDMIAASGTLNISAAYRAMFANGKKNRDIDPVNNHVCLRVDGVLYDSDGHSTRHIISDAIAPESMVLALAAKGVWNSKFKDSNKVAVHTMRAYINDALAPLRATA